MVHIEKDPNSRKLEHAVAQQLENIFKTFEPKKEFIKSPDTSFISVEDAAKELLQMGIKE